MRFLKSYWDSALVISVAAISTFAVLWTQLKFSNPFVASWDQVDFSLAVTRFDLRAMQPHFPGYPYFILGGMIVRNFTDEPSKALVLFNVLFYLSTILPMYFLGKRIGSKVQAVLFAATLYTLCYPMIIVNEPMSEGAALAACWWYFWSIVFALEKKKGIWTVLPLIWFSVLLGIRLSYLPMGLGLLFLFYQKWKKSELSIFRLIQLGLMGVVFQLIWVGALILSEGGFSQFFELAIGFTNGHFHEWGGSISSNHLPIALRIIRFFMVNVLWWGVGARSLMISSLYLIIGVMVVINKCRFPSCTSIRLAGILFIGYGCWALFAQNIDKPRHILPLAILLIFILLSVFIHQYRGKYASWLVAFLVMVQSIHSISFIHEQATVEPAVYQLNQFLVSQEEKFVLYTWEETRVLDYLNVPYPHKKVYTYNVFKHDANFYHGSSIYLTESVVKGFESQGADTKRDFERIKEFNSNKIFDPVYSKITLYKWTANRGESYE